MISFLARQRNMATKYGILVAESAEKWGGADGIGKMMVETFKKKHKDEEWEYFKACEGELPDKDKLSDFKGLIVSGSINSANDDIDWIKHLEEFCRTVHDVQTKVVDAPKLVGICFGHQLINKAFGAKVTQNHTGNFILHQEDINISKELQDLQFYKNILGGRDKLNLIQSHGEEVIDLPPSAKVLGSSKDCQNEIVLYEGEKILTFQGHCEITKDEVIEKIYPAIKSKGKFNGKSEEVFWKSMNEKENSNNDCIDLIREFIG